MPLTIYNITHLRYLLDTMKGSKDLLMNSLTKFYSTKAIATPPSNNNAGKITNTIHTVANIIEGKSDISLRLIDWFVTNYSKKYNTIVPLKDANKNVIHFNVYLSYRSQLKSYSKHLFDPFRRRDRIEFPYENEKKQRTTIETTVGQLNFFRWILQNNLLQYIVQNHDEIESDMLKIQKENQEKKKDEKNIKVKEVVTKDGGVVVQRRKKRIQLSQSNVKNMNLYKGTRVIEFN